jgi:hypothetical protein
LNEEFFNSSSYPIPDLKYVLFTTKPIAQTNPSRPINIKIKKFNVKQFYVDGSGERTINIGELIK